MKEIEKAFESTCTVLFGKKFGPIKDYAPWLLERIEEELVLKSPLSGKKFCAAGIPYYKKDLNGRLLPLDESLEIGKKHISQSEAEGLSLANAKEKLGDIAYISSEISIGENIGVVECAGKVSSQFCYHGTYYTFCKYCAYSWWPRQSEYVFGAETLLSSKFCIKCYSSTNLTRCFEVSDSNNCSDCYFCHNCENVTEGLFCFNAKGLRYAIGNKQVSREEYARVKKMLLQFVAAELERKKKITGDIFSIDTLVK